MTLTHVKQFEQRQHRESFLWASLLFWSLITSIHVVSCRKEWDTAEYTCSLWGKYQDSREKCQQPQACRRYHPHGRTWRETKEPLGEGERGEWKSWLKTQHSENEDHGIRFHHFMANRWGNNGNRDRLYLLGLQNHHRQWLQPWN